MATTQAELAGALRRAGFTESHGGWWEKTAPTGEEVDVTLLPEGVMVDLVNRKKPIMDRNYLIRNLLDKAYRATTAQEVLRAAGER